MNMLEVGIKMKGRMGIDNAYILEGGPLTQTQGQGSTVLHLPLRRRGAMADDRIHNGRKGNR
jgi:hypothetical protein